MANRFINQAFGQAMGLGQHTVQQVKQQINQEEVRIGSHTVLTKEQIAEGGFGVVWLVFDPHTRKEFVLKRCNIDREEIYEVVRREINVLQRYSGPYIVQLIDSDTVQRNRSQEALLLMEYYPGGHLMSRLQQRQGQVLPLESIYRIFGQLCEALLPFHKSNPPVAHRDLKLENILFGADGKVRLCDFGSCLEMPIMTRNAEERRKAEESIMKETTQMYRAPEMVDLYMRPQLTAMTDVWALGCIFYALCYLAHPFPDGSSLSILGGKVIFPTDKPSIPADNNTLILRMMDIDPEARPDLSTIIESIGALAAGQPLPAYELSEEAKERRKERLARDEVRQNRMRAKEKKKGPQSSLPKTAVKINPNSAAAKRLAAKRGQTPSQPLQTSSSTEISNAVGSQSGEDSPAFEPFAAFGDSNVSSGAEFTAFDPSFDTPSESVKETTFGDGFSSQASVNSSDFDPFAANRDADSFDPFDNSFGSRPQSGAFSAFENEASVSERLSRPQSGAYSNVGTDGSFGSGKVSRPTSDKYSQSSFDGNVFDAFEESSGCGVAVSAYTGFEDDGFGQIPSASKAETAAFDPFSDGPTNENYSEISSPPKEKSAAASLFAAVEDSAAPAPPSGPPPPVPAMAPSPAKNSRTPPPKPPKRPSGLVPRETSVNFDVNTAVEVKVSDTTPNKSDTAIPAVAADTFDPFGDSMNFTQSSQQQYYPNTVTSKSAPATPSTNQVAEDVNLLEQDLLSMEMPSAPVRAVSDSSQQNVRSVLDLFDNPNGGNEQNQLLQPTPASRMGGMQPLMNPHIGGMNVAGQQGYPSQGAGQFTMQQHPAQRTQQQYGRPGYGNSDPRDPFGNLNQFGYGQI